MLLALLLALRPAYARDEDIGKELKRLYSEAAMVTHSDGLEPASRQVISLYPKLLEDTEDSLGIKMPPGKTHITVLNDSQFNAVSGNSFVMALAIPSNRTIVLNYDALNADPQVLRATLKHEISHLLIHSAAGGSIPRWLDEGISQWASGGHSEIRQTGRSWPLSRAALTGRLMPLGSLAGSFPGDEQGIVLAYQQSLSAVDLMVSEYGPDIIRNILTDTAKGSLIQDSFYRRSGLSLDDFAKYWEDSLRKNSSIISFFKAHFYEVLFLLASIALTLGFIMAYWRIRTYRDPEEESGAQDSEDWK